MIEFCGFLETTTPRQIQTNQQLVMGIFQNMAQVNPVPTEKNEEKLLLSKTFKGGASHFDKGRKGTPIISVYLYSAWCLYNNTCELH